MDYTTLSENVAQVKADGPINAQSLYEVFAQVKDGRKKRGVRYPLALILTLIVLAKLAGETSLSGVADWARERKDWLAQALGLPGTRFPCMATYSYVLRHVEAEEVTALMAQFFTRRESEQRCGNEPSRLLHQEGKQHKAHTALDGKTMRGTLKHESAEQEPVHLLALYETQTGVVLARYPRTGERK